MFCLMRVGLAKQARGGQIGAAHKCLFPSHRQMLLPPPSPATEATAEAAANLTHCLGAHNGRLSALRGRGQTHGLGRRSSKASRVDLINGHRVRSDSGGRRQISTSISAAAAAPAYRARQIKRRRPDGHLSGRPARRLISAPPPPPPATLESRRQVVASYRFPLLPLEVSRPSPLAPATRSVRSSSAVASFGQLTDFGPRERAAARPHLATRVRAPAASRVRWGGGGGSSGGTRKMMTKLILIDDNERLQGPAEACRRRPAVALVRATCFIAPAGCLARLPVPGATVCAFAFAAGAAPGRDHYRATCAGQLSVRARAGASGQARRRPGAPIC